MENGHTTGAEREVWMERVNFDGQVTGETARALIKNAKRAGITPQEFIQNALRYALGEGLADVLPSTADTSKDVKAEPMTINAGNGGFHVLTFVADGYGNLVVEDTNGKELARRKWEDVEEGGTHDEFRQLADEVLTRQEFQG